MAGLAWRRNGHRALLSCNRATVVRVSPEEDRSAPDVMNPFEVSWTPDLFERVAAYEFAPAPEREGWSMGCDPAFLRLIRRHWLVLQRGGQGGLSAVEAGAKGRGADRLCLFPRSAPPLALT